MLAEEVKPTTTFEIIKVRESLAMVHFFTMAGMKYHLDILIDHLIAVEIGTYFSTSITF